MSVTNAISSVIVVGALIAVSVSTTHPPQNIEVAVDTAGSTYINGVQVAPPGVRLPADELARKLDEARASIPSYWLQSAWISKSLGFVALILASVNIFGGFLVTQRMLAMYKKKEKK